MYVFAERLKEQLYSVEQQLSSAIARGNEIQVRINIYIYIYVVMDLIYVTLRI